MRPEEAVGGERLDDRLLRLQETIVKLEDKVPRVPLEVVELIEVRPEVAIEMHLSPSHDRLRQAETIGDDAVHQ